MPYEIVTIPCLADNYAFLIANTETGEAAIVDVPEAGPINEEVAKRAFSVASHLEISAELLGSIVKANFALVLVYSWPE